jgi:DNA-binding MurR/RpiR family transcriptional regulator
MFRKRIQEHYDELTPRFRVLADYILEHTLDVGFLTATALSRRVNVDPATVVRFSQEIGYSGYRELSREIKDYVNNKLALRYKKGAPEEAGVAEEIAVLTDELSDRILSFKADVDQIAEIAQALNSADRIFISSTGESYGIATLWAHYLCALGLKASPMPANAAGAALLLRDATAEDIVFGLSLGLDPDLELGNLLRQAKEASLTTVSVTTSPTVLTARQSTLNLPVPAKTPSGYPSFDTFMAALSLIWQALIKIDEERSRGAVQNMTASLVSLVEEQADTATYDVSAIMRLWNQE